MIRLKKKIKQKLILLKNLIWSENISNQVIELVEILNAHAPSRTTIKTQVKTIIEVGASDGASTNLLLKYFPNSKIYSFEPEPREIGTYLNAVNNERAILNQMAVGNYDGLIDFHRSSGTSPSSGISSPHNCSGSIKKPFNHLKRHPWVTFNETMKVNCIKLDTWAKQNNIGIIDLLWADVQGAEEELIKGATETLKKTRYFYTEYSDDEIYKDQINLEEILKLLPNFELLAHHNKYNVVLRNKSLTD